VIYEASYDATRKSNARKWHLESQFIIGINGLVDFESVEYSPLEYSPIDETSETQGYEYHDLTLCVKFDEPEELDDRRNARVEKE